MQQLISLCNIISKQKIKDLYVFDDNMARNSKQFKLYQGLVSGDIKSDSDVIEILYQGEMNEKNLRMLKYRLRQKLLNALLHIDLNKPIYSDYSKSRIAVFKDWSFTNILLYSNVRPVAIDICQEALHKALRYGFTDLVILLSRILLHHYAYLDINKRKHKYYESLIFEKLEVLNQELITEKYYCEISQDYVRDKSPDKKNLKQKIKKYCEELSAYETKNKTYTLCFFYYRLLLTKHLLHEEYLEAKSVGFKGLKFFTQNNLKTLVAEFLFRQAIHVCHIHLHEYDEAIILIKENLQIVTPYKLNWYKELGYYFGWAVITKNYNEMVVATSRATNNKHIKNYPRFFETWSIKEAYVNLFISLDKIDSDVLEKNKLKRFRIKKFINDVPKYSQDKRGLNVSILIAHFMHLLIDKKYDLILNKIENLNRYSYRYLRNDSTLRSNCFIKMLSKIPDANYHPVALSRKTKKIHGKLLSSKYTYTDNPVDIEIIPYETLWELVLEILAKNEKRVDKK